MTLQVRRCGSSADVEAMAELRRVWGEEQRGSAIDDESFDARFARWYRREEHRRVGWLAEDDAEAIGMLNLLVFTRMPRLTSSDDAPRPQQWGYIANVYVRRLRRDSGIGSALVRAAVDYADEHGFARLVLSPSERSIAFYERAGFAPTTSLMLRPAA